ncbi:YbhB/YbcL family Raf kinase inhibitor-like protein [Cognatazoarcus halotolerans]|uniref:YbhB/YbcL family Raf kinase inhibitor-like protein n=1 Tax=Cognatazoarcus halotolerans TaxID=2686016 RepID=UPI001359B283|nr:YbhB/YbcL family Raf kinase inhibitor-like protein [Cognatazoarcus halotolerans]MBX3680477.1 YbhB/YbcL family Raf kinase inhibitor-like protein [Rhodocyclaceae bacterium]MCB1900108.1 YbhB/YbcL family Raf kinase inhibitor-like protein [Rhodocyclaceae bacterium]MCP5311291.1 YbhB/YbcL family Raf kinase inhibitor-like protein [Zoogloeaceae bacterium]
MKLTSTSFNDGERIPDSFAFCNPAAEGHVALAPNRNPQLAWSGLPPGTRSLALICHDPDVPSRGDDVNQEGRTVPASLPRVDFFHWILVDLPADASPILEAEFSDGVTATGKSGPAAARGTRQGINDYTGWFASDAQMSGDYYGYDGPCPPWNDEIIHRYVFTLYALDVERPDIPGAITGQAVRDAISGHVLDKASITGTYSLNPSVKP